MAKSKRVIALEGSIKKWERNLKALNRNIKKDLILSSGFDVSVKSCPLCKLYFDKDCTGCPIKRKTGNGYCEGSPYYEIEGIYNNFDGSLCSTLPEETLADIVGYTEEEIAFLKSLLPKLPKRTRS